MTPLISFREAIKDPNLLGKLLSADSWRTWLAILLAALGEPLTDAERSRFQQVTSLDREPGHRIDELCVVAGRRAGKSRAISVLATYLAALCKHNLVPGETGVVLIVAADRKQAGVILDYCEANFKQSPYLSQLVTSRIERVLRLNNGCEIEVRASNFRTVRGITCVAAVADELCFWRSDEDSSNPDRAIIDAIRPTLATTKGPLALISSPYARRGVLFDMWSRYFGKTDDPNILVAHGPTRLFNSSLPQKVIDRAYEHDPISAASEYGGEWRTDVENFLTREIIDSCVPPNRYELPVLEGVRYHAFVDPSGGIGDSFALAIAHAEGGLIVLDLLREHKSPLNPEAVIAEFADTLKDYRIHTVTGDHYGGMFPRQEFAKHDITYRPANKSKSDFYQALLPVMNSGRVQLLDNKRLISQLIGLERRTARGGRDSIDHSPGGKDDLANTVAGVVALAAKPTVAPVKIVVPFIVGNSRVVSDPSRPSAPAWHNVVADPWPFPPTPSRWRDA
jgi:hypothetical protein